MPDLPPATLSRIAVLELRQRLEIAAVRAHDLVVQPEKEATQNRIVDKLACLLALPLDAEGIAGRHGLVRLSRQVYLRSSDFLHGRSSMVLVPEPVISEWKEIVSEIERLTGNTHGLPTPRS